MKNKYSLENNKLAEDLESCIIDEYNINVGFDMHKFIRIIKDIKK
jgi:hypothetical protein